MLSLAKLPRKKARTSNFPLTIPSGMVPGTWSFQDLTQRRSRYLPERRFALWAHSKWLVPARPQGLSCRVHGRLACCQGGHAALSCLLAWAEAAPSVQTGLHLTLAPQLPIAPHLTHAPQLSIAQHLHLAPQLSIALHLTQAVLVGAERRC